MMMHLEVDLAGKGNMDYWDNWRNRLNSEQGVPYYSPRLNEQAGYTPKVVC